MRVPSGPDPSSAAADVLQRLPGQPAVTVHALAGEGWLRCVLSRGLPEPHRLSCAVAADAPLWGRVAWTGTGLLVPDADTDPLLAPARAAGSAAGVRTALAVPAQVNGAIVGVLSVYWPGGHRPTAEDRIAVEGAARLWGLARLGPAAPAVTVAGTHDPLTHLPNRALLVDHLNLALAAAARSGSRPGVLFCDLDGFKTVNDSLGTPPATPSCRRWPAGSPRRCDRPTRSPGWAATSSSSCAPI